MFDIVNSSLVRATWLAPVEMYEDAPEPASSCAPQIYTPLFSVPAYEVVVPSVESRNCRFMFVRVGVRIVMRYQPFGYGVIVAMPEVDSLTTVPFPEKLNIAFAELPPLSKSDRYCRSTAFANSDTV